MTRGFFITGSSTEIGKTFVTRGLAKALTDMNVHVAAIKPIETGYTAETSDAKLLARACQAPPLAEYPDFYRTALPIAPYAAELEGLPAPPKAKPLASSIRSLTEGFHFVLVEGIGGAFVPLSKDETVADLIRELEWPVLFVAPNKLGVLSDVIAYKAALAQARIQLAALVLVKHDAANIFHTKTNAPILAGRLDCPIFEFPFCENNDIDLADAAVFCGLRDYVLEVTQRRKSMPTPRPSI